MSEEQELNNETINETEQDAPQTEESNKKYAGKYETIEELEKAVKHSAKAYQEKQELEKQLEQYKPPEQYQEPEDLRLESDQIQQYKDLAKSSNLNQQQFEEMIKRFDQQKRESQQTYQQKKEEMGENQFNALKDFIQEHYPASIQDKMLEEAVMNDQARQDLSQQRSQTLNNSEPGISSINTDNKTITKDDLNEAYKEYKKRPSNKTLKHYLDLAKRKANSGT